MFILKIEIEGKLVKEIEKQLSIDTNVIRYLTVKYDKIDLKNEFFGSKKIILMRRDKKNKKGKKLGSQNKLTRFFKKPEMKFGRSCPLSQKKFSNS